MTKDPTQAASSAPSGDVPGGSHALTSSPASTGGAGTAFEQHVDAYWLAQLLVRGIPPILHDCAVVEVHLQTAHLGWQTTISYWSGRTDPEPAGSWPVKSSARSPSVQRTTTASNRCRTSGRTLGTLSSSHRTPIASPWLRSGGRTLCWNTFRDS